MVIALILTALSAGQKPRFVERNVRFISNTATVGVSPFPFLPLPPPQLSPTPSQLAVTQTQQPLTSQHRQSVKPQPQIQANACSLNNNAYPLTLQLPAQSDSHGDHYILTPVRVVFENHRPRYRGQVQWHSYRHRRRGNARRRRISSRSATQSSREDNHHLPPGAPKKSAPAPIPPHQQFIPFLSPRARSNPSPKARDIISAKTSITTPNPKKNKSPGEDTTGRWSI